LNQWDVLKEFAQSINHPEMILEAAWRNSDWTTLKESSAKFAINETPHGKLFQIYLALQERRLADREIDKLCDGGMQLALREWQGLPPFVGNAHLELLQRFQRLVEVQESGQMLLDINNYAARQGQLPHFKSFLTTWKERLCNKWEEIPVWSDVFTWRSHMFSLITSTQVSMWLHTLALALIISQRNGFLNVINK
jgi:transformation/transcription domain-associated protein